MKINNTVFDFLTKLKENNNRDWFNDNKEWYLEEKSSVNDFFQAIKDRLEMNDQIEKMHFFRIYKDVRFSKDKTPYKTHFGASFTRATNSRRGELYFHIEPGNNFIGGGFFMPTKEELYRIRKEIEYDDSQLRKIIHETNFVKAFGELEGKELKTAPRGFSKEHPAIDLLRKKQLYVTHYFKDKEVMMDSIIDKAGELFEILLPYHNYMSDVLNTDLNGELI